MFKKLEHDPNPAQYAKVKEYSKGYRRRQIVEERIIPEQAYPMTVQYLNIIFKLNTALHPFLHLLYKLSLSLSFLTVFRVSEALDLRWEDVKLKVDNNGREFLCVRLVWYKSPSTTAKTKVYWLYSEYGVPELDIVQFFIDYSMYFATNRINSAPTEYLFPGFQFKDSTRGDIKLLLKKQFNSNLLRQRFVTLAQVDPNISDGLNGHSSRRGGAYYRVFDAANTFNMDEMAAFGRWEDVHSMARYLVTENISSYIDTTTLLNPDRIVSKANDGITNRQLNDLLSKTNDLFSKIEHCTNKTIPSTDVAKTLPLLNGSMVLLCS